MQRTSRLSLSITGSMWVNKFRYGFENAPVFGSLRPRATDDHAQRLMYSKALVYASGGSRLSRDWLAGCAALSLSDGDIVQVALQHDGTYFDVLALEAHLVRREQVQRASAHAEAFSLLHGKLSDSAAGSSTTTATSGAAAAATGDVSTWRAAVAAAVMSEYDSQATASFNAPASSSSVGGSGTPLSDDVASPTLYPLTRAESATIRRCFLYDAVKASSFQTSKLSETHVAHLEGVCRMLGLHSAARETSTASKDNCCSAEQQQQQQQQQQPSVWTVRTGGYAVPVCPLLMEIMAVVEEENRLMREKFRVIDQR